MTTVETVLSDDEGDLYTAGEFLTRSGASIFCIDAVELHPRRKATIISRPQLTDTTPNYIMRDADGSIVVRLEGMDSETRLRTENLMGMYCTDDATHLVKCLAPIAVLADVMKTTRESIALEFSPQQVADWDPLASGGKFPSCPALDSEQAQLMHALHIAVNNSRTVQGLTLGLKLSKSKSWVPKRRLWRQGRQYYADFQHMHAGKSFAEIEAIMRAELGQFEHKTEVDERLRQLKEGFMEERRQAARAVNLSSAAATVVLTQNLSTAGSNPTSAVDSISTVPNAFNSTQGMTATIVRGSQVSGSSTSSAFVNTSLAVDNTNERRRSSRNTKRPPLFSAGESDLGQPQKKRATLKPSRTKRALPFNLPDPTAKMVPPKLVQNDAGEDAGYTAPSNDWIVSSMNKLILLKNLGNYCSLEGICGPRALMDSTIDELMGGGEKYDRSFILLLSITILDQLEAGDEVLYQILLAMKTANVLTPASIAQKTAAELKDIVRPFDRSLKTAWMVKLCTAIEDDHDGLVPASLQSLLDLNISEISHGVASEFIQEAFGLHFGPVVDTYYGCNMAIALELIDLEEHHYDKSKIDASKLDPTYVRESLLSWLPQAQWKEFHTLMVSTAQLLTEGTNNKQVESIRKIIRKKFGPDDKIALLGMVDSIIKCFERANE